MTNMSYCRFENTYRDLNDCYDALSYGDELSESEQDFRERLVDLCRRIAEEFIDENDTESS
jgi:hypothetical protein